jgi:transcriptional regulator with XRE-family HTH domain
VQAQLQFGRNLRGRRVAAGWSQQELSDRCDLHLTEISRLENGHRNPRMSTILKLADALKVAPGDLLAGTGAYG